jgi:hypothetical protein
MSFSRFERLSTASCHKSDSASADQRLQEVVAMLAMLALILHIMMPAASQEV